jgi:hypothetical protein
MKSALLVAAALATLSSFPVIAQQTPDQAPQQQTTPAPPPDATSTPAPPPEQQAAPPDTQQAPSKPAADSSSDQTGQAGQAEQASPAANDSAAAAVEMSPVKGELVGKLDTASAKAGDSVILKTKESVKTADGTEIPKGSKLVGRVTQVQPHGEGKSNSQIALQFDHAELKGGQNVAIQSAIQSVAPSTGDSSTGNAGGNFSSMPSAPGSAPSGGASGSMSNSRPNDPASANAGSYQPGASGNSASSTSNSGMAAGTVVQRNGNIAISTTAIPGVLLANNAPGQHDPRMASASGILLGTGRDVHLDGGTQIVVAVAAAPAAAGTAGGSSNR